MKTKNFKKTLALNKRTIANLGYDEMKQIKGMVYPNPTPPATIGSCEGCPATQTSPYLCN